MSSPWCDPRLLVGLMPALSLGKRAKEAGWGWESQEDHQPGTEERELHRGTTWGVRIGYSLLCSLYIHLRPFNLEHLTLGLRVCIEHFAECLLGWHWGTEVGKFKVWQAPAWHHFLIRNWRNLFGPGLTGGCAVFGRTAGRGTACHSFQFQLKQSLNILRLEVLKHETLHVVCRGCRGCRAPARSVLALLCNKVLGHGGEHPKDGDRQFVSQAQGAAWRAVRFGYEMKLGYDCLLLEKSIYIHI